MPLAGLNYGRALASAAGAAQNQRHALATLIGVWGGGRDYRTSGGGTDYRVAAAQRAEAERQQYEQEQADKFAKDQADFEQQKELEKIRFDNQKELQRLRGPGRAGKVAADGSLIPKPLTLPEIKYEDEKAEKAGDAAINRLPVFSSMPFSQRPSFSEDMRKERKDALDRQDRMAKEQAKPPPVALQKFQQEQQARAADDAMSELPVFSSMPFSQRPAFSEQQKKERKIERDRQEKIAKEDRDRAAREAERAAPSARELEMERIRQEGRQTGRLEADKIRDENARVAREQKVADAAAKDAAKKAESAASRKEKALREENEIELKARKRAEDAARKAVYDDLTKVGLSDQEKEALVAQAASAMYEREADNMKIARARVRINHMTPEEARNEMGYLWSDKANVIPEAHRIQYMDWLFKKAGEDRRE